MSGTLEGEWFDYQMSGDHGRTWETVLRKMSKAEALEYAFGMLASEGRTGEIFPDRISVRHGSGRDRWMWIRTTL
jgi:hypothetical protein